MAQSWKQRFTINPNTGGGGGGGGPQPGTDLYDKLQEIIDRFTAGMIDADEATRMATAAINRMGEDAGLTARERKEEVNAGRDFFGTDATNKLYEQLDEITRKFTTGMIDAEEATKMTAATLRRLGEEAGYSSAQIKEETDRAKEFFGTDDRTRLEEAYNDAIEKFTKGLITADEAVRRQQAAVNRFGESLGMTVEQRKQMVRDGFEDVRDEAEARGQDGPMDPDNPFGTRLGRAFGKLGLPKEFGEKAGGVIGQFNPKGGILGDIAGKGGLLDAIGGMDSKAGSIAGPLAVVAAGSKVLESFYKSVQETTRRMVGVGEAIAGNDGIGAITGAIEGVGGQITSNIPVIGGALQAQVEMYTGFLKAFDQVTEAFKRRGEELRRFDSSIAGASANAQVTKLLGDMNEAQKLGNEYAAIIREKAELQAEFQQALIPIKSAIMQQMIPILRTATDQLKLYNELAEKLGRDVKKITEAAVALARLSPAFSAILEISKIIKEIRQMGDKQDMEKSQAMMKKLFDLDGIADMIEDREMKEKEERPLGVDLFRS